MTTSGYQEFVANALFMHLKRLMNVFGMRFRCCAKLVEHLDAEISEIVDQFDFFNNNEEDIALVLLHKLVSCDLC